VAPGGSIANCKRVFDGTTITLAGASTPRLPATRLFTVDAYAEMDPARAAGVVPIINVADTPEGDRQRGVRDPAGTIWWIRTGWVPASISDPPGYFMRWRVKRVISDGTPRRSAKPGHNPVPLLT
jgi:hypothetical protein